MATEYRGSNIDWSDTHTVLTELIQKMEGEKKDVLTYLDPRKPLEHNAAIDRCIALVKEVLKDIKK